MHNTKKLLFIIGLLLFSLLLISADYAPTVELSRDNGGNTGQVKTRKQKRLDKRTARLNKHLNKLSAKLDETESVKKRERLKKQIKHTKSLQDDPSYGLAILALFLGLLGFLFFPAAIVAIIIGTIALNKIDKFPERFSGWEIAQTGLILGVVAAVLFVIIALIVIIAFATSGFGW
ncbi:MAG: DUF4190 domain-containing protein [Aureispira sp.]|nr:DUF4190 domain-containing protein [Aureispira sp.]